MTYMLGIYIAGLALMLLGYIRSPEHEKAEANPAMTFIAYVFWPLSVSAVLMSVALHNEADRVFHVGAS